MSQVPRTWRNPKRASNRRPHLSDDTCFTSRSSSLNPPDKGFEQRKEDKKAIRGEHFSGASGIKARAAGSQAKSARVSPQSRHQERVRGGSEGFDGRGDARRPRPGRGRGLLAISLFLFVLFFFLPFPQRELISLIAQLVRNATFAPAVASCLRAKTFHPSFGHPGAGTLPRGPILPRPRGRRLGPARLRAAGSGFRFRAAFPPFPNAPSPPRPEHPLHLRGDPRRDPRSGEGTAGCAEAPGLGSLRSCGLRVCV